MSFSTANRFRGSKTVSLKFGELGVLHVYFEHFKNQKSYKSYKCVLNPASTQCISSFNNKTVNITVSTFEIYEIRFPDL